MNNLRQHRWAFSVSGEKPMEIFDPDTSLNRNATAAPQAECT